MQSNDDLPVKKNEKMISSLIGRIKKIELRNVIVYIAFIIVFIFFSITLKDKGFLSSQNLVNVVRQTSIVAILAFGMTFVIGGGQIDLTIGATASIAGIIAALTMRTTDSTIIPIIAGLGVGALIGFINASIVIATTLPSFLVTIGMMTIIRGLAMWISKTAAIPIYNETFVSIFGTGKIFGIPVLIIWLVGIFILTYIVLKKTSFGVKILATGGNENAAIYSGINVRNIKLKIMILSGLFAALAGLLYLGRLSAAHYTYGEGIELSVIAAVVLGGTTMHGGKATLPGTLVGALLMTMLDNGVIIAGMNVEQQMIIRGVVTILATALGSLRKK